MLDNKLATFSTMAEGSRATAEWALLESKNIIADAKAEGEAIKDAARTAAAKAAMKIKADAEEMAANIKAAAEEEAAEILEAADDIETQALTARESAIAFKQKMVAEAAEIKEAAKTEAAKARHKQSQFLSLLREKIANITVETAMEAGILDLRAF